MRDEQLLLTYQQGLERLYQIMTAPPLARPGLQWKTQVQIFDLAAYLRSDARAFTAEDQQGVPYIALPSRTKEPTQEAEQRWALATAVHEATHVFNCRERPLSSLYAGRWAWFDEALAVFMEMQVLGDVGDHFRVLGDWIENPELSLDAPNACYQAGLFVAYMAKRLGIEFVNRVWMESEPLETPLDALARLMPAGQIFLSAKPDEHDLFASGYCLDSWFLADPASAAHAPELFARFGERAVSESFVLGTGEQAATGDTLDHLACRYYRFYLNAGVRQLRLELETLEAGEQSWLKAEVAMATNEKRCGLVIPLRPATATNPITATLLSAQVTLLDLNDIDHLILVVTNCGTRAAQVRPDIPHDDRKPYAIRVWAE
ncbi:MAG: hypothetical protein HYR56_35370 [Acidobacteria bacterium]|nr:hypothetical protein [Acidobacteriota bacterium]MBI3426228.1 hypothetical protein [Acidobacteriota bacterium]